MAENDPKHAKSSVQTDVDSARESTGASREQISADLSRSLEKIKAVRWIGLAVVGALALFPIYFIATAVAGKDTNVNVTITLSLTFTFAITTLVSGGYAVAQKRQNTKSRKRVASLESKAVSLGDAKRTAEERIEVLSADLERFRNIIDAAHEGTADS